MGDNEREIELADELAALWAGEPFEEPVTEDELVEWFAEE